MGFVPPCIDLNTAYSLESLLDAALAKGRNYLYNLSPASISFVCTEYLRYNSNGPECSDFRAEVVQGARISVILRRTEFTGKIFVFHSGAIRQN
jgi:hypothetical protein